MIDSYFLFIIGFIVVFLIISDFFYTTLSFNGAGYINRKLATAISSVFLFIRKHTKNRKIFKFSGLSQILLSIISWIGLLLLGFFLILLSSHSSVLYSTSRLPAGVINKLYFGSSVIASLGTGEFIPGDELWQLITLFFLLTGFIFITTAVSYLLNLNSAVIHKRSLALSISNIGETPEEIIDNTYSEGSFQALVRDASGLMSNMNKQKQNHYAYPISHFFFSTTREESFPVNLANLSEALTLIKYNIDTKQGVKKNLRPLNESIDTFIEMAAQSFTVKTKEYGTVSLNEERLKKHGIHLIEASFDDKEKKAVERTRATLSNLLISSGWSWQDLYNKDSN
ncbi:MAG TPA: hypothetical protein VK106_05565 [Balneolaceae bacterium]|nr:hypothetical protein [Balneolaceae bacterium]